MLLLALLVLIPMSACAERESTVSSSSTIVIPYDSMAIAEDEEVYIGNPFSLVVVPADAPGAELREIWVSDFLANTILQFDRSGNFQRRIGQPGPGPHEFEGAGLLFLTADSEVGAVEFRRRELKWFDRESGDFLRTVPFESGSIGMSPPVRLGVDPVLVFPLLDPLRKTSLGIFDARTRQWTRAGSLPAPYRRSVEQGRGAFAAFF